MVAVRQHYFLTTLHNIPKFSTHPVVHMLFQRTSVTDKEMRSIHMELLLEKPPTAYVASPRFQSKR